MKLTKKIVEVVILVIFVVILTEVCKYNVPISENKNNIPASDINILLDMRDGLSDADILKYYKSDIEDVEAITNGDITIYYYDVDLNEDNQIDKIVHIRSSLHSGSHGDMLNILIKEGNGYREALTGTYRLFSQWEQEPLGEIYITENVSEGFRDIRMISDGAEITLRYEEGIYQWKEARNQYFFETGTERVNYQIAYILNNDFSGTVDLKITKIRELEGGEVYELKIECEEILDEEDDYAFERFHLGYFYVTPTRIYRMNDEKVAIVGTEEEIMATGTIVCAMWENEDNPEEKGWHEYITLEENRCEFHSYNNSTETGFYESFTWEAGNGLVEYRSGYGAGRDSIWLQRTGVTEIDELVQHEELLETEDNAYCTFPELAHVLGEAEFVACIETNPIDKAMKWEDISSEQRIMFAADYRDAWLAEIEHAFTILHEYLSESDYDTLYASYESWMEYMEGELEVEKKIYYSASEYMEEGKYAGFGMYYPIVMERAANRTKEYAVELLSLEFAMTGDVQFIYGQEISISNKEMFAYMAETLKNELYGEWEVVEYLGSAVEYHGAEPKTVEEIKAAEEYDASVKEKYLGTVIKLTEENTEYFGAPCEMGYYYEDYSELFMLYRQPHTIEIVPPFTCASMYLKSTGDNIDIIIDGSDMVVLEVRGNFFRIEKAEVDDDFFYTVEDYLVANIPELEAYREYIRRESEGNAFLTVDVGGSSQVPCAENNYGYLVYVGEQWEDHRANWDWFFVKADLSEILYYDIVECEYWTLEEWRASERYRDLE